MKLIPRQTTGKESRFPSDINHSHYPTMSIATGEDGRTVTLKPAPNDPSRQDIVLIDGENGKLVRKDTSPLHTPPSSSTSSSKDGDNALDTQFGLEVQTPARSKTAAAGTTPEKTAPNWTPEKASPKGLKYTKVGQALSGLAPSNLLKKALSIWNFGQE